jgi:hypothetical protein
VAIWIYEGQLHIEYRETLIARYRCAYDQRQKRLREVSHPTLYTTVFASPQLELIELDDTQWIKVQQRAWHRRTQRMPSLGEQLMLGGVKDLSFGVLLRTSAGRGGEQTVPQHPLRPCQLLPTLCRMEV